MHRTVPNHDGHEWSVQNPWSVWLSNFETVNGGTEPVLRHWWLAGMVSHCSPLYACIFLAWKQEVGYLIRLVTWWGHVMSASLPAWWDQSCNNYILIHPSGLTSWLGGSYNTIMESQLGGTSGFLSLNKHCLYVLIIWDNWNIILQFQCMGCLKHQAKQLSKRKEF